MSTLSSHLCECGCGQPTKLADRSDRRRRRVKGQPYKFLCGHHPNGRNKPGFAERKTNSQGYVLAYAPEHPRADLGGRVLEHILIIEAALGKPLREGAEGHHVDRDRANNANTNLVACDSHSYHLLLHQRQRALDECGDANALKCSYCGKYDSRDNLVLLSTHCSGVRGIHRACRIVWRRQAMVAADSPLRRPVWRRVLFSLHDATQPLSYEQLGEIVGMKPGSVRNRVAELGDAWIETIDDACQSKRQPWISVDGLRLTERARELLAGHRAA